jgi:hypothetical protein
MVIIFLLIQCLYTLLAHGGNDNEQLMNVTYVLSNIQHEQDKQVKERIQQFCLPKWRGPENGLLALTSAAKAVCLSSLECENKIGANGDVVTRYIFHRPPAIDTYNGAIYCAVETVTPAGKDTVANMKRIVMQQVDNEYQLLGIDKDAADNTSYQELFTILAKHANSKPITLPDESDPANSSFDEEKRIFSSEFLKEVGFKEVNLQGTASMPGCYAYSSYESRRSCIYKMWKLLCGCCPSEHE